MQAYTDLLGLPEGQVAAGNRAVAGSSAHYVSAALLLLRHHHSP